MCCWGVQYRCFVFVVAVIYCRILQLGWSCVECRGSYLQFLQFFDSLTLGNFFQCVVGESSIDVSSLWLL